MKVSFTITIEVDGEHSKTTSTSPMLNALSMVSTPEAYKRDVAQVAHLLVCHAMGLAGSVGVKSDTLLSLKTPWRKNK